MSICKYVYVFNYDCIIKVCICSFVYTVVLDLVDRKYSLINRASPYKEYVEALRAHFFLPKATLENLEKIKMVDFRDEANETVNSDNKMEFLENLRSQSGDNKMEFLENLRSQSGDNKIEFLENLRSQFFIAKTEAEISGNVKIMNPLSEAKDIMNTDPSFSSNNNDFKEDNSYTLAVVRNRRKMLRDASGESESSSFRSGRKLYNFCMHIYLCMYCMYVCMYLHMHLLSQVFMCICMYKICMYRWIDVLWVGCLCVVLFLFLCFL